MSWLPPFASPARVLAANLAPCTVDYLRANWGERCRIDVVENAFELFHSVLASPPDGLVVDAVQPGGGAADLVRAVRAAPSSDDLPIVVFARAGANAVTSACVDAGAELVATPRTPRSALEDWFASVQARRDAALRPPVLNSDMATSIATASQAVLSGLLGVGTTCGELRIERTRARCADVLGSVNIAGFVDGGITIFLGMDVAEAIAVRMLGDGIRVTDAELVDAVGELVNMLAGNIKTCLCRTEDLFSMSPPSVVIGREVRRLRLEDNLAFVQPYELGGREILVEFNLVPRRNRPARAVAAPVTGR